MPQQNEKKLPTKQKMTIANVFRKILQRLVKRSQIDGLIILHFHIYILLRNLYQLTKYNNLFSVPPQSIPSLMMPLQSPVSQQIKWNSSMSPFQYELVPLPDSVTTCYECSLRLTDCYRYYPKNIIIRHRNRRIMGKNIFGDLTYSSDFEFTYYHLSRDHPVRKNPNFQNNPYVYASPKAFVHFNNDLELKTMICKAGLVLCSL